MQGSSLLLGAFQTGLRIIYPPRCLACAEMVETAFSLCGPCRRETHVIGGTLCQACGAPQLGASDEEILCDGCLSAPPVWSSGRAALMYKGVARDLVLSLKYADRPEIARGVAPFLHRAATPLWQEDTLIIPVPLTHRRLLRRRYNQAALLAQSLGTLARRPVLPDALLRQGGHQSLEGLSRKERFDALSGTIRTAPRAAHHISGRHLLLVDDVMTTGATLSACAKALFTSNARDVSVLTLARVAPDA